MILKKGKMKYPTLKWQFNPNTDTCLRSFNIKEAFVHHNEYGGVKLYCDDGSYTPIFISSDKFLYITPSFNTSNEQYVEAFLLEYAPYYPLKKAKQHMGSWYFEYIGNLETVTL